MVKEESSTIGVLGPTALSLAVVAAGLATPSIIGKFHRLFLDFGAELPWLTSAILSFRIPVFLALLLCLIAQVGTLILLLTRRTPEARRLFYRIAKINLAFFAVLIVAMYVPVFKIGSPV